jgi:hypothetical protein
MAAIDFNKHFEKAPMVKFDITSPGLKNCFKLKDKFFNDKFFYIDEKTTDKHIEEIYENIRIFRNNEIKTIPNGVYTWILTQNFNDDNTACNGPFNLYFNKVLTPAEVKTLHANLLSRLVDVCSIRLAGEFRKDDNKVVYNFLSGTYMLDSMNVDYIEDIKVAFEDYVKNHLSGGIINIMEHTDETLITNIDLIDSLILEDLLFLNEIGIPISVFSNRKDCEFIRNYTLNIYKYNMALERHNKQPTIYPVPIFVKPEGEDFKIFYEKYKITHPSKMFKQYFD